jgi:hypothetical protein
MSISSPDLRDLRERLADLETKVAVLVERLDGSDEAKVLAAEEYERRLNLLNNAHERAERALERSVQKDAYEDFMHRHTAWMRTVDAFMTSGQTRTNLFLGILGTAIGVAGLTLAVFNYLARK